MRDSHLNTSHVIFYRFLKIKPLVMKNLNTSHVIFYLGKSKLSKFIKEKFKYISCYLLSSIDVLRKQS